MNLFDLKNAELANRSTFKRIILHTGENQTQKSKKPLKFKKRFLRQYYLRLGNPVFTQRWATNPWPEPGYSLNRFSLPHKIRKLAGVNWWHFLSGPSLRTPHGARVLMCTVNYSLCFLANSVSDGKKSTIVRHGQKYLWIESFHLHTSVNPNQFEQSPFPKWQNL